MIFLLLVPVYLAINGYILFRTSKWLRICTTFTHSNIWAWCYMGIYILLAFSLLFAFILPKSRLQLAIKHISNYWLGTFMYTLIFITIGDFIKIVLRKLNMVPDNIYHSDKSFVIAGSVVLALIVSLSVYGIVHAHKLKVVDYTVDINKPCVGNDSLKIVLISDLHLGYSVGVKDMEDMVRKVNAQNADIVVLAGDIFDNDYDALDDPDRLCELLGSMNSRYGTYGCYGNHDIEERLLGGFSVDFNNNNLRDEKMEDFMKKTGIHMLLDECILIDDSFYLAGRLDIEKPGSANIDKRLTANELLEGIDYSKPVIVMDHQPKKLKELANAGCDLDLSGHTHDGQLFPGNVVSGIVCENVCGLKTVGNMTSVVTAGVGLWGPNMRVGTTADITVVNVNFNNN